MKPEYLKTSHKGMDIELKPGPKRSDPTPYLCAYVTDGMDDKHGYLASDLPENGQIWGQHSDVYIDGSMGKNSHVSVRSGSVSASSLAEGAEVQANNLLIISNEALSKKSKNFTTQNYNRPTIIVVPEEERSRVFSTLAQDPRPENIKKFLKKNPRLAVKIYPPEDIEKARELLRAEIPLTRMERF